MFAMTQIRLISPAEAAERLQISVRRVQKLCEEKRLGQKVGGNYVIPENDLERFSEIPRFPGKPKSKISGPKREKK